MEDRKVCDRDLVANAHHGFGSNSNEGSGSYCRTNIESNRLCDELKCSLLKLVLQGADKVFKDQKSQKANPFTDGHMQLVPLHDSQQGSFSESGRDWSSSSEISQGCKQENARVGAKLDKAFKDSIDVNVSEGVHFSSEGYSHFPLNFLTFIALLVIRYAVIQFRRLVSLLILPIWLAYFSFMFLLFPFQILRHLRGYVLKKLLRMWGVTHITVACYVSEVVRVQKSLALRVGCAFFSSMYIFSILVGLLVSAFVLGCFMMQYLVEKPVQTTETLNSDYTKASPVAFIPIMLSSGMGNLTELMYNANAKVDKKSSARVIPYNRKLQLTVALTLPESECNRELGVFQVDFLSADGNVTASSSCPCMLIFKSQRIQFVQTLIKSAPLSAGFQSESQVPSIKNEFTEGLQPTACLKVTIEQRAEHQHGAAIPQSYAAPLAPQSELPLLKKLTWYWRSTIFLWVSNMIFLTELVFIIVVFRPIIKVTRGRPKIS